MAVAPVASLGWVSPGAATDGVTNFFIKNTDVLFSHRPLQSDDLPSSTFWRRLSSVLSKFSHKNYLFHSGVTPLDGLPRGGPPNPLWRHWVANGDKVTATCKPAVQRAKPKLNKMAISYSQKNETATALAV